MNQALKLSSRETGQFWPIPVLFEDDQLLALDKPSDLPLTPDLGNPNQPSLMSLVHRDIENGATWARARNITFLANANRIGAETSGVLLLAKTRDAFTNLADQFGSEKPYKDYLALVHGTPGKESYRVELKISTSSDPSGRFHPNLQLGKKAITLIESVEQYSGYALVRCRPLTNRPHQIRIHLSRKRLPIVGDSLYGGHPLQLSTLKPHYRLRGGKAEKPLIGRVALHSEAIHFLHPVTGESLSITAPQPRDFLVALKYLNRYAPALQPRDFDPFPEEPLSET
jgi:23S rRNA pseudouridine955/2504/2580 synthase